MILGTSQILSHPNFYIFFAKEERKKIISTHQLQRLSKKIKEGKKPVLGEMFFFVLLEQRLLGRLLGNLPYKSKDKKIKQKKMACL